MPFSRPSSRFTPLIALTHKTNERIRAHAFVCMLAYYLLWHAACKLAPIFADDGTVGIDILDGIAFI